MNPTEQLEKEKKELFLTEINTNPNGRNSQGSREISLRQMATTQSLGWLNKKIVQVPTEHDYFDKLPIIPGVKFFISATNYHNPLKELKVFIPKTILYNGGTSYMLKTSLFIRQTMIYQI